MDQNQKHWIIVPKTLTWDKLCALYVHIRFAWNLKDFTYIIDFEDSYASLAEIPTSAYDIDVREKYNRTEKFGSATERLVKLFHLEHVPGMMRLVDLLGTNNQTGWLKSAPQSLVALIRQSYEVSRNVDFDDHRRQVISLFWPVMDAYFAASQMDAERVADIANPFTMDGYREMLGIAGIEEMGHLDQLERWFEKARVREEQAHERANNVQARTFVIDRFQSPGQVEGHLLESDDQRLSRAYWKEHERSHPDLMMVVTRKSTGHYAVLVRGRQDLRPLYRALDEIEPGRWFLDERPQSPILLNGSSSRVAEPSTLKPTELIALIQLHHRHRSRRQQEQMIH